MFGSVYGELAYTINSKLVGQVSTGEFDSCYSIGVRCLNSAYTFSRGGSWSF